MQTTVISIIGLGGVGGYFGFKLAQKYRDSKEVNITFIARGKTYEVVKQNGLTLLSPEHKNTIAIPDKVLQSIKESDVSDLFIICVKEYDLEEVCINLKDKINEHTVLLPLMNGVDIYERIRKIIPQCIILPSCVYVASHIKDKGIVEHKGNPGKIIIGKDPHYPQYDPKQIIELLKNASINMEYKGNSFPDIWTKYFFIASFGLVSARYNKSIGQINKEPDLHGRALLIMKEIEAIAYKKDINLPQNIIEQTFQKSTTFPYDTPTSLQLDVRSGKKNNELELFAGAIINYGKETRTSVVETEKIYYEIKKLLVTD